MRFNIDEWQYFRLGDLFAIKKGKRLTKVDQISGSVPYIGSINSNNGVSNYIAQAAIHKGNTITLNYNGSVGEAFYQPKPFWASDDVNVLYLRPEQGEMNCYIGMYICTILKQERYKYCWGRKWTKEKMEDAHVKLPSKQISDDTFVPDWKYMDDYIKSLNWKLPKTNVKEKQLFISTLNWHEYRYDEVFDIRKGFYNKKPERELDGTIPFIAGTGLNNGVTEYYSLNNIEQTPKTSPTKGRVCKNAPLNEKLFPEKAIVVTNDGSVGYAFYQKDEFTCSHSVNPLYRKDGGVITPNIAMFICTVIMQDRYRWDYGRKWRPERMAESLIKLPSKQLDDGTFVPDWEYMENFIAQLPYSDCINT